MTWERIGVAVELEATGKAEDPCAAGEFVFARITDRRWHTPSGIFAGVIAHPRENKIEALDVYGRPDCTQAVSIVLLAPRVSVVNRHRGERPCRNARDQEKDADQ